MGARLSSIIANSFDMNVCSDGIGFGPLIDRDGYKIAPCFVNLTTCVVGGVMFTLLAAKYRYFLHYSVKTKKNFLYYLKIVISIAAFIVSLVYSIINSTLDLGRTVYKYEFAASWIITATLASIVTSTPMFHLKSKIPSLTLSIFWGLMFLLCIFYVTSTQGFYGSRINATILITLSSILAVLSLSAFVVESFKKKCLINYPPDELPLDYNANLIQRLFFSSVPHLAIRALKKELTLNDFNPVHKNYKTLKLSNDLFLSLEKSNYKSNGALLLAIFNNYKYQIIYSAILKFCQDILIYVNAIMVNVISNHFSKVGQSQDPDVIYKARVDGVILAVIMLFIMVLKAFFLHQYFYISILLGLKTSTAMSYIVYKKSLNLSPKARIDVENGKIINLMSVDSNKFIDFSTYAHLIWSAPLQLIIGFIGLYLLLGISFFYSLIPMILIFGSNFYAAIILKKLNFKFSERNDDRIKYLSETFRCIKLIKYQAWEIPTFRKICELRDRCINVLKLIYFTVSVQVFSWRSASVIMTLISIIAYSAIPGNVLTTAIVVTTISLFGTIQYPINMLPATISSYLNIIVVCKRIRSFMVLDEDLDDHTEKLPTHNHDTNEKFPPYINIENASFSYSYDKNPNPVVLKDLYLKIDGPQLHLIIGRIGSSKSSLLMSIIGQLNKLSGSVTLRGTVCYVPQKEWVINDTFKNNVTLGSEYDENKYKSIIEATCLIEDIKSFPFGDNTLIGERGFSLSGGQKQRLCLARAMYLDADIYLLDDILSAVDSITAKHILKFALGNDGLLKNKIRLYATLSGYAFNDADFIYMMDKGKIVAGGTYTELLQNEYSKTYIDSMEEAETFISEQLKNDASTKIPSSFDNNTCFDVYNVDDELKYDSFANNKSMLRKKSSIEKVEQKYIEKSSVGSVGFDTYKFFLNACKIRNVSIFVFFSSLFYVFEALQNYYITMWSSDNNNAFIYNRPLPSSYSYIITIIVLSLSSIISVFIYTITGTIMCCLTASKKIHIDLAKSVLNFKPLFFDVVSDGVILNRFTADINVVDITIQIQFMTAVTMSLSIITMIIINTSVLHYIIILFAIFAVIFLGFLKIYVNISRMLRRLTSVTKSRVFSLFSQSLEGHMLIRNYRKLEHFQNTALNYIDELQVANYNEIVSRRCLTMYLELIEAAVVTSCTLFASLRLGSLSEQALSLILIYSQRISQQLSWLVRTLSMMEADLVAVERIREYIMDTGEDESNEGRLPAPFNWPSKGKIVYKNYSAKYKENSPLVLNNISIKIDPGEKIGIVGRTGAGKTTLGLALLRVFEPHTGFIYIDDVDISKISLKDLRSKISVVPQDCTLFMGTIRSNLDPLMEYTDEQCMNSLRTVGADDFIKALPEGMGHEITNNGETLSAGERQLICTARAVLKKSKIVIMDESTASIDKEKDSFIQKRIAEVFKESTLLVIAHRLETVINSDKIIFMDNGKIIEYETPEALLSKDGGRFKAMIESALS